MKNMKDQKLTTEPYKGARDFYPEEKRIQEYLFNIWRETAKSFGYEEYDFPLLEKYELYEAKSGEDLVQNQLYSFEDRGGRKVAVRPEKTPSLARMVAARVQSLPKPIRWFNIGNCWRYEKPQRGRGREFYQFDCDIFGVDDIFADVEVFSIPIEVMKKLGATSEMFEIRVNNRKFAESYLRNIVELKGGMAEKDSQLYAVTKAIDSKPKISENEFLKLLEEAWVSTKQIEKLNEYLSADLEFVSKYAKDNEGAKELLDFFALMKETGYGEFIAFKPEIMRGLDYYTGMVIEQFDLNPKNNRSMYGGGRYENLIGLFSDEQMGGVGFAMGDMTLLEFLKGWNLLPEIEQEVDYYVTVWPVSKGASEGKQEATGNLADAFKTARKLREKGKNVINCLDPTTSISDQLADANKRGAKNVVIQGPQEEEEGVVSVKNMKSGEQQQIPIEKL
ncbi:histidine--tRNA ligase [candidate division WWE3 bacterium]|nr:histidine--tRNA ligase [candidate division WWE3 bacterium]